MKNLRIVMFGAKSWLSLYSIKAIDLMLMNLFDCALFSHLVKCM